ncbi:MAG: serine hydrolase domain-containing protein [Bacteroidota bacterium]
MHSKNHPFQKSARQLEFVQTDAIHRDQKRRILLLLGLTILISLLPFIGTSQNFVSNGQKVNAKSFDQEVEKMMTAVGVPAMSLAVMEDEKVVHYRSYGYKDVDKKRKANKRTVFEAASLTKIYLLYVAYKLVEEGRLDLEKPIHEYLPHEELAYDKRYERITVRQIVNHTSGMENRIWFNNPDKLELVADPGERFTYSGAGYQYLSKVVESITGRSYAQLVDDYVLDPLKLKRTFLQYDSNWVPFVKEKPANHALGYSGFGDEFEKWKNEVTYPASGAHTTANDYAEFFMSLFKEKVLTDESMEEILHPAVVFDQDGTSSFGIGGGLFIIYHPNDTIINWGGNNEGFRAQLMYSITHKRGFVYLTNSSQGLLLSSPINQLTAGLDLGIYDKQFHFDPYPSHAVDLLVAYREKGEAFLFEEMNRLKPTDRSLNDLGFVFLEKDLELTKRIAQETIERYPGSAMAYCVLGLTYFLQEDFGQAYQYLTKAKSKGYDYWMLDIEEYINASADMLAKK